MSPDRESFEALAERALADGGPAVVRASVDLDLDVTPLEAYAALSGRTAAPPSGDGEYAFLLESAEKVASSDPAGAFRPAAASDDDGASRHARYSFVGYDPAAVVTVDGADVDVDVLGSERYGDLVDPAGSLAALDADRERVDVFDRLRAAMPDADVAGFPDGDRQHLQGGLVGFLGYDAVYDAFLGEVGVERPDSRFPDAQFVLSTRTLVFDEVENSLELVFTPVLSTDEDAGVVHDVLAAEAERVRDCLANADALATGGFECERETAGSRESYEAAVERAKEHVLDGDVYQAVVSRCRELEGDVDALGLYESLREVNPSPYMYLLGYDGLDVVGASPETLVSVRGSEVVANPIAGTIERGSSPVEDRALAGELLADAKERAEHTMLVDLARNDVRRVSESGSVRVSEFMNVLKYSHVQHIESTVTGELAAGSDAFDATRASFPAGTLSGAPKLRAMEVVDALEDAPRGLYGGGVGYYSWTGDADVAIVIRTATVEDEGERDRVTVRAGAGVVADSDPASEYDETEQKMRGVLDALDRITVEPAREDAGRLAPGPEGPR
ncbi:anthranilate synthase component I [Halorubellus sp. JP-L1]|uniref:anthranilate synthase component I n=1 Tax=Halorubellus sp. JP-L1 TaxID=2715753 RepID=UPI0014089AB6|nr:anthranilate synthase component I [Halorubellus sp. JP-L1]NHN41383.1 anthranilate synthase component I [Halorubellus sp. JP-L1]